MSLLIKKDFGSKFRINNHIKVINTKTNQKSKQNHLQQENTTNN